MLLTRWITLRSLRTRKLRTLLSAFGVILGVAGLLAIQITNQTALDSLSALFEGTAGKVDLVVTTAEQGKKGLPERVLNNVNKMDEVQWAAPSVKIQTALAVRGSTSAVPFSILGFDTGGVAILGIDPQVDLQVREYRVTQGKFLSPGLDEQEIVLVESYALENELKVGEIVTLLAEDSSQEFKIIGLIAKEGAGQTNNGAFGVIPLATAQRLFGRSGEYDQIDIILKPVVNSTQKLEAVKSSLQDKLGSRYSVMTSGASGERVNQMLSGFSIGLNFMGGMALFVGSYLIYNAFSMTMIERTREIGLLRTLGLTRGQVVVQVLIEAAILGLGGSVVGAAFGVGLAYGAASLLAYVLNLQRVPVQVDPQTVLFSLLVGTLVTLIASFIPAYQAGRISPLEALRVRGVRKEGRLMKHGWKVGMALLVISTIILVLNPFPYDTQFRLGSITVVFLFLGGTLLIPGTVEVWQRITRPMMRLVYGTAGQLGSSNIKRSKLRTTLTVAALMVGVSMIIITRGMTDSFRGDLEEWIRAYIGGDLMVSSSIPMRSQMMRRLESVPGVDAVTPIRSLTVSWQKPDGSSEDLVFMGVDTATYDRVTTFVFSDSQTDARSAYEQLSKGKALFISSVLSEKYGLKPGDTISLRTRSGWQDFSVAAVVVNFFNQGLSVQGSWTDMRRYFQTSDANAYLVRVDTNADVEEVRQRIDKIIGERQNLNVVSNQSVINQVSTLLNQAYSMFDAMAVIAMMVGALGVVNTMTMNVIERSQEIGMLRSIGLTRGQTLVMVLAESLLLGLVGGILGLVFGILMTRIFLWSMTAMSGYKINFVLPLQALIAGLIVALIVSQLAALFPARRAAHTPILEAIHYE